MWLLPVILHFLNILSNHFQIDIWKQGYFFQNNSPCQVKIDSISGRIIYTRADNEPVNTGGEEALQKLYWQEISIPKDHYSNNIYTVAFIVETDGNISNERVLNDDTNIVGKQLLKVINSVHWTAGSCNGEKIAFLREITLRVEVE